MSEATPRRIALIAHETTESSVIKALEVKVAVLRDGLLALRYTLHADMSKVLVVPGGSVSSGRADGLWSHTCFEAFIQPGGSQGYGELNFSAAKQWAAYRFDGYRSGMAALELARAPEISVTRTADNLELDVVVALPSQYAPGRNPGPKLALTAVVEEDNGRLCYWSARHPAGRPDFHHPDGFVFEL